MQWPPDCFDAGYSIRANDSEITLPTIRASGMTDTPFRLAWVIQ